MALDLGTLTAFVEVDTRKGDASLSRFDRALQTLSRQSVPDVVVDADVDRATKALAGVEADTRALPDGDLQVDADVARAEAELDGLASAARSLPDGELQVDADVSRAERALDGLSDKAGDAGADGGAQAGEGLSAGILAAVATIPIAGAVVGIGVAIGKSLVSGLQREVREDVLVARTGLDPAVAQRIGRAAGEAYAGNFGESVEANFDTARAALQSGLLDTDSTGRDSQLVIEQLTGVANILGEDIPRVSRAVGVILKNGLATDAAGAFDILVKGAQSGANEAEDLLDTFTEYPAVLAKLGLDGADSLGLISQGLQAGARDSDFVADALKEFQIRATDASTASAAGYELIGLSAEGMTAKIAAGGEGARQGLQEVLDGLRAIEDPVKRNEAAVGLFGTKAEDLGDALFALDLNTVAADLGAVEGAASGAISALGDNQAGEIESAFRGIQLAADGIKGALAAAFGDQISAFAETVRTNREGVVQFLFDIASGAFDMGRALIEAAAMATEGFGTFISDTGPALIDILLGILAPMSALPGIDFTDSIDGLKDAKETLGQIGPESERAAELMRTELIENGIDPAQAKLDAIGIDQVTQARFSDATVRLADDVGSVGVAADGTTLAIDRTGSSFDRTSGAGKRLDSQIRTAVASLEAQIGAGRDAGRSTDELTADYDANRSSLIASIEAMGFSNDEARALADAYGAVPGDVRTEFFTPGSPRAAEEADRVKGKVDAIPGSKNVDVTASTGQAVAALADIQGRIDNIRDKNVTITTRQATSLVRQEDAMANRQRARGGPMEADGLPYLVGEEGPEYVIPTKDAYVFDARQTAAMRNSPAVSSSAGPLLGEVSQSRSGDTYYLYGFDADGEARARRSVRAMIRERDLIAATSMAAL